MAKVFVGVDPHKLSATIEVVDRNETVLATGRLADVGDVARFADRNRFASWTGPPVARLLREQIRHRLSRAGNRKANHVIHIAAACQIRLDAPGRAYYRRKLAAGRTRMEAMRCLKRRISDGCPSRPAAERPGRQEPSCQRLDKRAEPI